MRVLVTGGAGFIGSTVVDAMLAHGHEVYAVDDLSLGNLTNLDDARRGHNVTFHRFDIRSDGMGALIKRDAPEVVLHLAAQPSVPASMADPINDAQINVVGLVRLLDACVAAGVRKVVFASSGGTIYGVQTNLPTKETAQGRPISPYGITKRVSEDYLRFYRDTYDLDFTSLALANVYGPRQNPHGEANVIAIFAAKIIAGESPVINGTGDDTRDYVFVEDVAHAFVLASEHGSGETINISTGVETSVNEIFRVMKEASGFEGEAIYGPARPGDLPRNALDPSKAQKVLDWKPWTSFREGIERTITWFERNTR